MMRLLISQREEVNRVGEPVDSLEAGYTRYFSALGHTVLPVSGFTDHVAALFSLGADAVVLSGGGILSQNAYDRPREGFAQQNRDRVEEELIRRALESGLRILGICRGMQRINAYFGGRTSCSPGLALRNPVGVEHPVSMKGRTFAVNSYHSDGVFPDGLGRGLTALAANGENGLVEALCAPQILGVQWHPERELKDPLARELTDKMIGNFLTGASASDIV